MGVLVLHTLNPLGYVCDHVNGQCAQDPKGGTGDTKANCEKTCRPTPKPSGLSVCNTKTAMCEPCTDYCKADTDCPGSYCSNGLCHGSTCMQNTTCDIKCSKAIPAVMLGTWRGVDIAVNFTVGEYDMKIDKPTAAGAEVMVRGGDFTNATSSGTISLDEAGGTTFTLTFKSGPMAGKSGQELHGKFDLWEAGPETIQAAFYFGAGGEAAPASIEAAMKVESSAVLAMSKCAKTGGKCDFESVFSEVKALAFAEVALVTDPCNPNQNCSSCIGATSGLCGWCSTDVTYGGVASKSQCAGFDSSGKPLGWQCAGVFSKSACSYYGCDWTDISGPKCVKGAGTQKSADCTKTCVAPEAKFACNTTTKTCEPCNMHYCTSNTQCPGSYCNKAGVGPWSCHGEVPGGCYGKARCSSECGAEEEFAICDNYKGTCTPTANKTAPGAQSKYDCSHTCKPNVLEGTFRAIAISSGFEKGEWDFTFYGNATVHWVAPSGKYSEAALSGSTQVVEHGAFAVEATVTRSDEPGMQGKKLYALFRPDVQGNDGIVNNLFLGISMDPVATFDAAMAQNEWVAISCRGNAAGCDFSSIQV